jgi:general secretion pathway protein M
MTRRALGWQNSTAGRWLAGRSPRERGMIGAAALASAIALLWWGLWQPLTADVARLRAAIPQARASLADGRRMADAIPALERTRRAAPGGTLRAEVERVLAASVGPMPGAQLDAQGDRLRVTLPAVPFTAVATLLEALQRDGQVRLLEATLTARLDPGVVRAELLLAR